MRLSLRKRIGWTQVRGGRVMRVAATHGVATNTLSELVRDEIVNGTRKPRWPDGEPMAVFAQPGDLALEILHKNGAALGYTYLSGDAIQLNCYDAMSDWFTPATGRRFAIPEPPKDNGDGEAFVLNLLETMMGVKYSDVDLAVFEYTCDRKEPPAEVAQALAGIYDCAPVDNPMLPENRRTHVLGHIHAHRRKGGVDLHFQPPREASDFCATPFQIELALSAVE
jgi:hypothetical protein